MKAAFLSCLIICSCCFLHAQNNYISTSASFSETSRILLDTDSLTKDEFSELKKLEVPKFNFQLDFGYTFRTDKDISTKIGIGYRLLRYGSKIYRIPNGVINNTPQTNLERHVVQQNQFFANYQLNFKRYKILYANESFLKFSLVHNFKNYKIYQASFDENRNKGISGFRGSSRFKLHRFDLNLAIGLNYNLSILNQKFSLHPYGSFFILPYKTNGIYNSYLYFNKNVTGFLWDLGLSLQYNFKKD